MWILKQKQLTNQHVHVLKLALVHAKNVIRATLGSHFDHISVRLSSCMINPAGFNTQPSFLQLLLSLPSRPGGVFVSSRCPSPTLRFPLATFKPALQHTILCIVTHAR